MASRPRRFTPLGRRTLLPASVFQALSEATATLTTDALMAETVAGQLQRACLTFIEGRRLPRTTASYKRHVRKLGVLLRRVDEQLTATDAFTLEQLNLYHPTFQWRRGVAELRMLRTAAEQLVAAEAVSGREPLDPVANELIHSLLLAYFELKGRSALPDVRFEKREDRNSDDDVGTWEFGRFVIAVETALVTNHKKLLSSASALCIPEKRAGIRAALRREHEARRL